MALYFPEAMRSKSIHDMGLGCFSPANTVTELDEVTSKQIRTIPLLIFGEDIEFCLV